MSKTKEYYHDLIEAQQRDLMKTVVISPDQHQRLMAIKNPDSMFLSYIRLINPGIISQNGYEIRIAESILNTLPPEIKTILQDDQSTDINLP